MTDYRLFRMVNNISTALNKIEEEREMKIEETIRKIESNKYIIVEETWLGVKNYRIIEDTVDLTSDSKFHWIHKKHKDILEAYLLDNDIEIESDTNYTVDNFIEEYDENRIYLLKPHRYKAGKEELKIETIQVPNSELKFIKPTNFKIELLKECHDGIIAYIELDTGYSTGVIYNAYGKVISADDSEYRKHSLMLTPYQEPKKWYEIESNFPCCLFNNKTGMFVVSKIVYFIDEFKDENIFRLATNEEIESLKVK